VPLGRIVPLERTPEEQRVWDFVSTLEYPRDKEIIKRLPRQTFRVWLAAIDPKAVLLLDCYDQEFYQIERYQNRKRWYHEIADAIWRKVNGW